MRDSISDLKGKDFLILPIDGQVKVVMQREGRIDLKVPKFRIDLLFDRFSVRLDDYQYRSILRVTDALSNYQQKDKYAAIKPKVPVRQARQEWFKFAVKAAYQSARERCFSWNQVMQRKKDKAMYIELYKRGKNVPWLEILDPYEQDKLKGYDNKLDYDTIVIFRELADIELKEEAKKYEEQEKNKKKGGWFSSWWGGSQETEDQKALTMTEDDRQRLYKTVGYTVEEIQAYQFPPDYVSMAISFLLKAGEFQLIDATAKGTILNVRILGKFNHIL